MLIHFSKSCFDFQVNKGSQDYHVFCHIVEILEQILQNIFQVLKCSPNSIISCAVSDNPFIFQQPFINEGEVEIRRRNFDNVSRPMKSANWNNYLKNQLAILIHTHARNWPLICRFQKQKYR